MRRYSRIDASFCSYLAVCDRCAFRSGPAASAAAAELLLDRHLVAVHPAVARQRTCRERANV